MHPSILLPVVAVLCVSPTPALTSSPASEERHRMSTLQRAVSVLSKQLMMTQLAQEEMRRSDGDSGIKQVRLNRDGTRPYHCNTHSGPSVAAIHDHADEPSTCGMGEVEAVLNGVHFRTRHNDYLLRMPSRQGEPFESSAAVPFPAVPPGVLAKGSVEEQTAELVLWFKAWQDGDFSERDYRQYFKPLLCYLEGWWTTDTSLVESVHSQRHNVDARDQEDLQAKVRFTAYTGDKDADENLPFLPAVVLNVTDGLPVLARWAYRILCHPLHFDLQVKDLRPLDDLASRLAQKAAWGDYVTSRAARFALNPFPDEKLHKWSVLDKVLKHVPGLNGYGSHLLGETFSGVKLQGHNHSPLNVAYYHRWYKLTTAGAMGEKIAHMGFADRNLFVAETTQHQVAPFSAQHCSKSPSGMETCRTYSRRVSYAVPLEVVYLTPLHSWNPYAIEYKGDNLGPLGRTVTAGKRNGKLTERGAFNGTNSKNFYQTPANFFQSGKELNSDPADTVKGVVGVLDPSGEVRAVVASGVRIFLPEIKGLGVLRTRYPVMPVYAEGNTVWKEMEALREVVMDMQEHVKYFRKPPSALLENKVETSPPSSSPSSPSSSSSSPPSNSTVIQEPTAVLKLSPVRDSISFNNELLLNSSNSRENGVRLVLEHPGTPNLDLVLPLVPGSGTPEPPGTEKLTNDILQEPPKEKLTNDILQEPPKEKLTNDILQEPPKDKQPNDTQEPPKEKRPNHRPLSHVTLVTSPSTSMNLPLHVHYLQLTRSQLYAVILGRKHVTVRTTFDGGHSHLVVVRFNRKTQYFVTEMCDGETTCWDGHTGNLETICTNCSPTFDNKLRRYG